MEVLIPCAGALTHCWSQSPISEPHNTSTRPSSKQKICILSQVPVLLWLILVLGTCSTSCVLQAFGDSATSTSCSTLTRITCYTIACTVVPLKQEGNHILSSWLCLRNGKGSQKWCGDTDSKQFWSGKIECKGINLFSLANNFQQMIYYTALPCYCAFEIFMTEILVIIPVPPVNLFINGLTLWPWQATDSRNSSGHQFLRETPWWLICYQTSDSIVCPWFIMHYPSTMLNIVLFMQITEGHILTRLRLLFNEYINEVFLPDVSFWSFPG